MSANTEKFLSIELETQGRNTIPYIIPESIITIHGKNGVGKSMASTLLEIASGNYIFENEERFKKLKNVIESCEIKFKDDEEIICKVELKPHLWNFDSNLNIVNPLTIGKFFKAENSKLKEINFNDFQKEIYIRTIRGNESLAQQIYFFKDIFVAKITQKLEKLEKKISFLEEYKSWLYEKAEEKTIKEYANFQVEYNDKLDKINNLKSSINNRKSNLNILKRKLDLFEKLLHISKNDLKVLKEKKESKKKDVKKIQYEIETNYKKVNEVEQKLEELQNQFDEKTKNYLKRLSKNQKELDKIREKIKSQKDFDEDLLEEIDENKKTDAIKKSTEKKEEELKKIKKKIEDLTIKNERIIEINKFLIQLRDTCSKASSSEFGEDKIIKGKISGTGEISLSFSELYDLFLQNNIQFKQAEELKSYKAKVLDYNESIKRSRKSLDTLKEYQKVNRKIKVLEQKIRGRSSKLDDYIKLETKIKNLEKEKKERKSNIDKFEKEILENKKEIDDLSKLIEDINTLPSESSLINDLNKLHINVSNRDNIKEFCKNQIPEIKNEIDKEKNKLNKNEIEKERIEKEIEKTKEKLDPLTKNIKKAANEFGFVQIGEFITYFENHNQKLKKYLENSYELQTRLNVLKNDILKVLDGQKPINITHLEIINNQFDKIFKEIYSKKQFFEYVFKDYSKIKQFDIAKKSIIFETPEGLEETRDLEEFSSGEKTYAYCRSIISMSADIAKYNIVILDESYALLDHEHSQDLYNFQEEMIKRKGITKFINILPLKEDLAGIVKILKKNLEDEKERGNGDSIDLLKNQLAIVKDFSEKVSENGYYQEIHYPEYKRKELTMNVGYGVSIGKSRSPEEEIEEYDKEIPFSFILDGSNIAYSNRLSEKASIRNVVKCKKKLMKLGVPEKYIFIIFGSGVRHNISAKEEFLYNELLKNINVNQAPAERDDDWFIIKYAFEHNSYIITNDRYLDYRKKSPDFADFIKKHSIHYTTLGRDIQFDMGTEEKIRKLISENNENKSKIREI